MSFTQRLAYRVYRAIPGSLRSKLVRILTPNFTLGSIVLLYDETGRLLLVRKPGKPGWSLPGGLLNRGESPAATACRELREETGVALERVSSATPNALVYPRAQQVDIIFTATVDSAVPIKADGVEIAQVGWHNVERLPQVTVATARLLAAFRLGPYAEYLPEEPDAPQAVATLTKPRADD